jgi:hypothetical protein
MKIPLPGERWMSKSLASFISAILLSVASVAAQTANAPKYQSAFMRVELAPDQPAFAALSLDSLGKGKLSVNPLRPPKPAESTYQLKGDGATFEYRPSSALIKSSPLWTFEFSARHIHLRSNFAAGSGPPPLVLNFDPSQSRHALGDHQ